MRNRLHALLIMLGMLLILLRGAFTVVVLFPWADSAARRKYKQRWARSIVNWLGVSLEIQPCSPDAQIAVAEGSMLVANHISWLDIMVLNSWQEFSFVAKSEVRTWPIIGWLAEKNETLFIARGRRSAIQATCQAMQDGLQSGQRVVIFPEGTTTVGDRVQHFHTALFEVACQGKCPLQPLAISYYQQTKTGLQKSTAPAYIDDDNLLESMWSIARTPNLHARLQLAEPISPDNCQQLSRRELADLTEQRVAGLLGGDS